MTDHNTHPPGVMTRVALGVIGGNPDRAAWAGRDDQARKRLLAVSVVLLFLWVGFNVANAVQFATGDGFADLRVIALSFLIAGLYAAVDLALLQGRVWASGVQMARNRGFHPVRLSRGQRISALLASVPFAGLRLALAVTVALFAAFSFGLWYWEKDITARLQADQIAVNTPLRERIEAEIEYDLRAVTTELAQVDARMAARAASAQRAADQAANASDAQHDVYLAQITALAAREAAVDARIACVSRNALAEEHGLTDCSGVRRTAGQGARWRAASAEMLQLQSERSRLITDRTRIETASRAIPEPTPAALPDPESQRHSALMGERARITTTRPQMVEALIEADPGFVPAADGLLMRQKALTALAIEEPVVLGVMVITKAMFVLLDFAVLAIAFGHGPASIYALRQVVELETRAADEIAEGQTRLAHATARMTAAEVDKMRSQLSLLQAQREIRAEMRRIAISEDVLDQWSRRMKPDNTAHFDA